MFGRELHPKESEAFVCSPDATVLKSDVCVPIRSTHECWICYDSERKDAGPLIQPCACKGDVSVVHHECLKQWLMESYTNPENVHCKVCNELYRVQTGQVWLPSGLTTTHWFRSAAILSVMCSTAAGTCLVIKMFEPMYVRTISVGCAILVEYVCLRYENLKLMLNFLLIKLAFFQF